MSKIDFHIHTSHSPDADFSVNEIIEMAESNSMGAISFTDHNTIEAHREFNLSKINTDVEVITGIELDCCFDSKNFHLLGFGIDITNTDFDDWLVEFTKREMNAVPERMSKLQSLGFIIDETEVYRRAGDSIPQEELMAEVILETRENHKHPRLFPYLTGGERSDMPLINFFWDYLAQGKDAYVPVEYLNINEGVSLIRDNGGFPVLAHPGANFSDNFEFVKKIMNHGIEGIEAISTYHNPILTESYLKLAANENYLVACGSDFHGKNKPKIKIGGIDCENESSILKKIKQRLS